MKFNFPFHFICNIRFILSSVNLYYLLNIVFQLISFFFELIINSNIIAVQ